MFKLNKNRFKTDGRVFARNALDFITIAGIVFGVIALVALIFYMVRPIKFADIKVPVATDKSSYYPSQAISGIFFGETFYDGNVKILREVFCTNYHGVIKPPAESADGDFFDTIAKPREFNGNTIPIGSLPDTVPIGQNCVIRFTNVYNIQTPFGVRHEEYQYYTQNFSIITKERRDQLDCEAFGKTSAECSASDNSDNANTLSPSTDNTFGGGSFGGGGASGDTNSNNTTTNNTTNNSTTTPPAAPVQPPQECTINLLGIKLLCR
jgi:uncharacterized membrane protein YgcG